MADLPTLDFSKFTEGSHQDQVKLGKELVNSFRNHGFVKLVNHGFPDETITTMLDFVRSLSIRNKWTYLTNAYHFCIVKQVLQSASRCQE